MVVCRVHERGAQDGTDADAENSFDVCEEAKYVYRRLKYRRFTARCGFHAPFTVKLIGALLTMSFGRSFTA